MSRLLPLLAATTLLASGCSYFQAVPPEHRRAVVVSFDGGGERLIERMLASGIMPNLARLRREGVMADYSRTNFPSKTAAGHAALWTGAFGITNGITSNKVPPMPWADHTITEARDGFSSEALIAEPIFVTAARAGKRALVLQATHEAPFSTYGPTGRFGTGLTGSLGLMDGYSGVRGHEGVDKDPAAFHPAEGWAGLPASVRPAQEATLRIGDSTFVAVALDDPKDGTQGYDTLRLYADKNGPVLADLKPSEPGAAEAWSGAIAVATPKGPARTYVRLYDLDPALHHWLLFHTAPALGQSNKPELAQRYYDEGAAFIPAGGIKTWESGAFGPTMFAGGSGLAEDRYLDTVHFLFETYRKRARMAMSARDWDLLVSYVPFPDEAEHAWYGAIDDNSPSYDPKVAPVVWRRMETVCREVDGYIGDLLAGAGRDTVVAVASDHGMAGLAWKFYPNTALRQAGLLTTDWEGYIDLSRTKVIYAPMDGGYLLVNRIGRKGGIVPERDVPTVLAQAQAALMRVKAMDGTPVVTGFVKPDAETAELGIGGERGGDMYLNLKPGYYFDSDWDQKASFAALEPGSGGHIFDPRRPDMHAIQAYWGPGVKRGLEIPAVRNKDLAPTLCRLLGIPAPAQTTGRVITEALE